MSGQGWVPWASRTPASSYAVPGLGRPTLVQIAQHAFPHRQAVAHYTREVTSAHFLVSRYGHVQQLVALRDQPRQLPDVFAQEATSVTVLCEASSHAPTPGLQTALALIIGAVQAQVETPVQAVLIGESGVDEVASRWPHVAALAGQVAQHGHWAAWGEAHPLDPADRRHAVPRLWTLSAARLGTARTDVLQPVPNVGLQLQIFVGGLIWGFQGAKHEVVWFPQTGGL